MDLASFAGANKPFELRCTACGHVAPYRLSAITTGQRCKECQRRPTGKGRAWTHETAVPVLADANLRPLGPYPGTTSEPWPVECTICGRVKKKLRFTQVLAGYRCPHTDAGKPRHEEDVIHGRFLAIGLLPTARYVNVSTNLEAVCLRCGDEVSPRPASILRGERGCQRCGIERRSLAQMLDHDRAAEVMRAAGLMPLDPYPASGEPWRCLCLTCGTEVFPAYANVNSGQGGCHRCAKAAQSRRQSTPADVARAIMLAAGLDPQDPYSGNGKDRWKCRCLNPKCGAITYPRLATVVATGSRCEECAPYGFQGRERALVYVLVHQDHAAVKIGITSLVAKTDRIGRHADEGWTAARTWEFAIGHDARAVETAVKRRFSEHARFLTPAQMPQGGASETYPVAAVTVEALAAAVEELAAARHWAAHRSEIGESGR